VLQLSLFKEFPSDEGESTPVRGDHESGVANQFASRFNINAPIIERTMANGVLNKRESGYGGVQRVMGSPTGDFLSRLRVAPRLSFNLPLTDAKPGALKAFRDANTHFRTVPWPSPFDKTTRTLDLGDARDLSWIPDASVHSGVRMVMPFTTKRQAISLARMRSSDWRL
jgi:hypothetical protein